MSLNIAIVCGSVRENRRSILAARYIAGRVQSAGHSASLVDFKETPLPFVDTPVPPGDLKGDYPYEEVKQWGKIADAADGFILVAPEYNHGYSAVMKNALDWLYQEFHHKPVALAGVSDGKVGGARVIEQLRAVCGTFGLYDIKENLMFREVQNVIDKDGQLIDPSYEKQVDKMVAALAKAAEVLKPLRQ